MITDGNLVNKLRDSNNQFNKRERERERDKLQTRREYRERERESKQKRKREFKRVVTFDTEQ